VVLVGARDEPSLGIDIQNPFGNSHSTAANPLVPAERLGIGFNYVELTHLPGLGTHGAMVVEFACFGGNLLRVYCREHRFDADKLVVVGFDLCRETEI